jgi:O-antigen/teichoic acid export membrane protein
MSQAASRTWLIGAALMTALAVVQRGAGLIAMTVLARVLDTRGLGAYAFTQSTSQTFYGIARLGADLGMHVGLAGVDLHKDKERAARLLGEGFGIFLAVAVFVSLAMSALAQPIASHLFGAADLAPYVYAAAALFAGQTMSQFAYVVFAGLNAFSAYSRVTMLSAVVTMVIVTMGAAWGGSIVAAWGLVGAQAVSVVLLTIWLARLFRMRELAFRPRWPGRTAGSILRLGFPFYAGALFVIPIDFANLAHLSRSGGVETLGDLRVTQALISLAAALPTAIAGPTLTFLTERHALGEGAAGLMLQLKAIWILAISVAIAVAAIWPFAISIAFGPGFEAARTLGVLALTSFLSLMLLSVVQGGLLARAKSGALFWIGAVHAAALAALGWLMIESYGLAGYLIAQGGAAAVGLGLTWLALRLDDASLEMSPWMGWLLAATVVTMVLIGLDVTVEESVSVRILTAATALTVFVLIVLTRVLAQTERRGLWMSASSWAMRIRSAVLPGTGS